MSANYVQTILTSLREEVPSLDNDLANLYALLVFTCGEATTLKDVHDAWALWRNMTNPAHKSLIPFDDLTVEVQEMDRVYMDAIHRVAANVQP